MNLRSKLRRLGFSAFLAATLALQPIGGMAAQSPCQSATNLANAIAAQNTALVNSNWGAFMIWALTGVDLAGFGAAQARLAAANDAVMAACGGI